ncbi:MAG: hypothetical protein AAF206_26070 [Bacteroidota bacterium]
MTSVKKTDLTLLLGACVILISGFLTPSSPTPTEGEHELTARSEHPLEGAWALTHIRGESTHTLNLKMVKLLSGGHFMFAFFNDETQQFFSAGGGRYTYEDGTYTEHIDFHTIDPKLVGRSLTFEAQLEGDIWHHRGTIDAQPMDEKFERIETASGASLQGAWEMWRASNDDGKLVPPDRNLRTIKILSDTHFQWATYDSRKGEFLSSGGGSYQMKDGIYTEKIAFFSPDSLRVGNQMSFTCQLNGSQWHHQEYASRGLPINEIWRKLP